ncbi:MAG TPA: trigger factor [Anaerolineales bacterium]|nr:trigger factor [Anaerolineales bacterium]
MKIETQYLEDQQAKLTIEVEAASLEEAKRRAARKIASRTKIPGFRPGKAPYNIIQRHVGEEALHEEGLEILVNDLYPQALKDSNLQPYGPGRFEGLKSLDPLTLEFIVPLMAEVELGDYRSLRFPYDSPEISDDQVEEVLNNLRERQAVEEPAARPAEESDRVHIRLSARRMETEAEIDQTLIRERPLSVVITPEEEDNQEEWPFSGFSRQLIGLSAGEPKTLVYTFPETTEIETLKGIPAQFEVQVEEIRSRTLPELSDEFAQSVGEYETLEALRQEIRDSLQKQVLDQYHSEYNDQVVNAAVEQASIKYPPQMLENEIDEVIEQLEQRLKGQSLDLETYLKTRSIDEDELREEARPVAENRLERSLVIFEIANAENIRVEREELQSETERTLGAMSRFMSESELKKMSTQNLFPNLVGNILAEMRIDRTLERLRDIAKGEYLGDQQSASDETEMGVDQIAEVSDNATGQVMDTGEKGPDAEGAILQQAERPVVTDSPVEDEPITPTKRKKNN